MRSPSPTRSTAPSEPRDDDEPQVELEPDGASRAPNGRPDATDDRARKSGNTENQDPTRPPP